jgi:hypothetical protein
MRRHYNSLCTQALLNTWVIKIKYSYAFHYLGCQSEKTSKMSLYTSGVKLQTCFTTSDYWPTLPYIYFDLLIINSMQSRELTLSHTSMIITFFFKRKWIRKNIYYNLTRWGNVINFLSHKLRLRKNKKKEVEGKPSTSLLI